MANTSSHTEESVSQADGQQSHDEEEHEPASLRVVGVVGVVVVLLLTG